MPKNQLIWQMIFFQFVACRDTIGTFEGGKKASTTDADGQCMFGPQPREALATADQLGVQVLVHLRPQAELLLALRCEWL